MSAAAIPVQRFNSGLISPRLRARTDLDWFFAGLEVAENGISLPEGPFTMRPGSWHAGGPRVPGGGAAGTVRFRGFTVQFAPVVAYMIEITDQKMRFWVGGARTLVMDPVTPANVLEVAAPWVAADLAELKFVQSADTMWIFHPDYQPRKLKRTGNVGGPYNFTLEALQLLDGPYYAQDTSGTTLTLVGTNLSSSAPLFSTDDVGRSVRLGNGSAWGWVVVTAFVDAQNVTVEIKATPPGTSVWRLGLYSPRTGWPACGDFHQGRLFLGSNPASSFARVDGSCSNDFDNFAPDKVLPDNSTSVTDASALAYVLATRDLPFIYDLIANRSLVALTSSGEMEIGTWQDTAALTPNTAPPIRAASREGAGIAAGLSIHDNVIFLQRYRASWHEMSYDFGKNGLKTRELSIRSGHLGDTSPYVAGVWANRPWNLIWQYAEDGSVTACTYTPEQSIIASTHNTLGGTWRHGAARIETMDVIPGATCDEVWFCAQRTIDGQEVRQIGTFADLLHDGQAQDFACFLDQSVTATGTKPAAGITLARVDDATVSIAADADVFAGATVGKRIFAVQADGRDRDGSVNWSRVKLQVTAYTDARHVTARALSNWLPASGMLAQGEWYYGGSELTGLDHLEGETVGVLADGAELAPQVVKDGKIVLQDPAGIVTAGLLYTMELQPVEPEGGGRQGTAKTRKKSASQVALQVVRSGPFKGGAPDNLFDIEFRSGSDETGEAVPLFTGVRLIGGNVDDDGRLSRWKVTATGPLPVTIAAAVEHRTVNEATP